MRKFLSVIATLVILFTVSSARNAQEIGVKVDDFAPNFTIENEGFSLNRLRGKFVLLNFWSSDIAESRIRNIMNDNTVRTLGNENLIFASVNFDRSESLFAETVRNDKVSKNTQFYESNGTESNAYKEFHLAEGLNSYLIDRNGKIMAINPTPQQLAKLMRQ